MFKPLLFLNVFFWTIITVAQELPTTQWKDQAITNWYSDSQDVFEISTPEALAGLSVLVSEGKSFDGKTIKLTTDLNLEGNLWLPIGVSIENSFKGKVQGNDYTISNVIINQPDKDFTGFFGSVLNATIADLHIDRIIVYGQSTVGALAANLSTDSSIENCSVKNGFVQCQTGWDGGIAGGLVGGLLTRSTIKRSSFSGEVHGGDQIGGLVGTAWDTTLIEESFSEGLVKGDNIVGGLVGFTTMNFPPNSQSRNYLKNSYSRSNVIATGMRAGGLYGSPETNGGIENCYSTGTVEAAEAFGASIGNIMYDTFVINTFWDKESSALEIGIGEYTPGDDISILGKTTEEMKTEDFVSLLDNGQNLWIINPSINDGYPILAHQSLSIQQFSPNSFLSVYPSVTSSTLYVDSNLSGSLSIADMTGKILFNKEFSQTETIDVANLQAGVYLLIVQNGNKKVTQRFIKQ